MSSIDAERRSGRDRRGGRQVMSRGPIIRTLELAAALTGIVSIAALAATLLLWSGTLGRIQTSRARSATATCYLIRRIVLLTPRHAAAVAWLDRRDNPLRDCDGYGRTVTAVKR